MIYVDSVIVLLGVIVFRDWRIPLYSWIVIFVTGKVIDVVLDGITYDKTLLIVSDHFELITRKNNCGYGTWGNLYSRQGNV